MKLMFCNNCLEVFSLVMDEERSCTCGEARGQYTDELNATYYGKCAVPLGFRNSSFLLAMEFQPEKGQGADFAAFVIPKKCGTFVKKDYSGSVNP